MQQLTAVFAITDLTRESDAALRAAAALAQTTSARLHVANALSAQLRLRDYLRLFFTPQRFARLQARLLQAQLERVLPAEIEPVVAARLDPTAEALAQQVRDCNAELIVVSRAVSGELTASLAEQTQLPTLIVGDHISLPVRKAVIPISTPVPNQEAIALARSWTELLSKPAGETKQDGAELELLQMAYLTADTGMAAATINALRNTSGSRVKLSWRASSAEWPARQVRRLAERDDVDLVITPMKAKRTPAFKARLSPLDRTIVRACRQPVLVLPLVRERAEALAG